FERTTQCLLLKIGEFPMVVKQSVLGLTLTYERLNLHTKGCGAYPGLSAQYGEKRTLVILHSNGLVGSQRVVENCTVALRIGGERQEIATLVLDNDVRILGHRHHFNCGFAFFLLYLVTFLLLFL